MSRFVIILSIILFICGTNSYNRRILPTYIEVREGEDIQVRFLEVLENEISCYARSPTHINCNLKLAASENITSCNERLHYWSTNGTCGFYIINIQKQDEGLWRLTSRNDENKKLVDVVKVVVLARFNNLAEQVEIIKGLTFTLPFPDADKYCIMQHPHDSHKTIINNVCNIEMETVTTANEGNWSVIAGISGQIEEVVKTTNVFVFHERLDSGYTVSSNPTALHLFCNLEAYEKSLTACRFVKIAVNQTGLRLRDGLRKGRYEYYGNGLAAGECGLTIQSPEEKDYGNWYCMLRVQDNPIFGTIVNVFESKNENETIIHDLPPNTWSTSPVLTTEGEIFKLECFSNVPLSYCWFSQPDGEILKVQPSSYNDAHHSSISLNNFNEDLILGNCATAIQMAEKKHNGTWTCHMGPVLPGMELSQEISVRIADTYLISVNKFVFTGGNNTITLQCKTVPRVMALKYCRFYSPSGFGININEQITKYKPIKHGDTLYWYSGKSIAAGDCGLVIEHATLMDDGEWTCAAQLEKVLENGNEAFDTIRVIYESKTTESIANLTAGAATGIVFGIIVILILLAAVIVVSKKKLQNYWMRFRSRNQEENDSTRGWRENIFLRSMRSVSSDSSSTSST